MADGENPGVDGDAGGAADCAVRDIIDGYEPYPAGVGGCGGDWGNCFGGAGACAGAGAETGTGGGAG